MIERRRNNTHTESRQFTGTHMIDAIPSLSAHSCLCFKCESLFSPSRAFIKYASLSQCYNACSGIVAIHHMGIIWIKKLFVFGLRFSEFMEFPSKKVFRFHLDRPFLRKLLSNLLVRISLNFLRSHNILIHLLWIRFRVLQINVRLHLSHSLLPFRFENNVWMWLKPKTCLCKIKFDHLKEISFDDTPRAPFISTEFFSIFHYWIDSSINLLPMLFIQYNLWVLRLGI